MRLFVGDDWAEDHHDVELMDVTGRRLAKARLPEGVAGIARLHAMIGEQLGEDADEEDAGQVAVGIETDRGPWVAALIAAGYTVYAINPLQASRYRERHGVSGAKSDAADAHVLADMVRTDSHQLRPVAGDSALAAAVKVVTRTHKTLIWERTRHASGCGTRCGIISPPRWRPSRTSTRPTPWNCWPGPRPSVGGEADDRADQRGAQARPPPRHRREGGADPGRAARRAPGPARQSWPRLTPPRSAPWSRSWAP